MAFPILFFWVANPDRKDQPLSSFPPPRIQLSLYCCSYNNDNHTKLANAYPREGRANQPKRREGPIPFPRVGRAYLSIFTNKIRNTILSLPILRFVVGSDLTLPLLLGQAWPPFLLALPLTFPFSPFWLGLTFTSFGSGPTLTPRRKGQPHSEKEGPTLTPRKRPTPNQEKEGPIPFPRVGRVYLSIFMYKTRNTIMSLPHPSPFLPFWLGPGPSHCPLFGWAWPSSLVGRGLASPDPEKESANPHPEKKGRPLPKGRKGRPQPEGPNPTRRTNPSSNWKRKAKPLPREGPTSTPKTKGQPSPEKKFRPIPKRRNC